MMPPIDPRTVGAQIRMKLPLLTPLEARVVDIMTGRVDFSEATALRDVAEDAGVSDAMIVKIAKKLGFSGYRDIRAALATYNYSEVAALHREISPDDSSQDIIQKVFHTSIQALQETMSIINIEAFDRATDLLHRAKHRDFYGFGGSAQIARDVTHKFLRIGIRCNVIDDVHMMLMSAALLGPEDVAVCFSHSGATTDLIEAARLARQNGARTICLTNYADTPLAEVSDVVLCSTAQGSPLLGENAAARVAQLNIMDAVFVSVAQRNLEVAECNLEKTIQSVSKKRSRK